MDAHTTSTTDDDNRTPWYDGKMFKSCLAAMPFIRWAIIAVMFTVGLYMYQRDTNAQQNVSVADIQRDLGQVKQNVVDYKTETEKQMLAVRRDMLTRELAEAWRQADVERMARIEKSIEVIATRTP